MIALVLAIALSATPAQRHAAFLKKRLDGSVASMERMRAELKELDAYWAKRMQSRDRAQAMVAWRKRQELLDHFAEAIVNAPVPPDVVRLGDEAVAAYKEALRSSTR